MKRKEAERIFNKEVLFTVNPFKQELKVDPEVKEVHLKKGCSVGYSSYIDWTIDD